jgi:hypothetical protein
MRNSVDTCVHGEALQEKDSRILGMPLIDSIKEKVEKITGLGRPTRQEVDAVLRPRKPSVFRFADDGIVPNNGKLALILYRGPIRTAGAPDPAALFEANAMDGRARGETASMISSTHLAPPSPTAVALSRLDRWRARRSWIAEALPSFPC